jgi:hypothetical protein
MIKSDSKDCPYCGEEIKIKAIKCKHCKSSLEKNNVNAIAEEQNDTSSNNPVNINNASDNADRIDGQYGEHAVNNEFNKDEVRKESSKGVIFSIVAGSVGLFLSWLPVITLFFSGIGLIIGIKNLKSNKRRLAIVATGICSIGLLINLALTLAVAFSDFMITPESQTITSQSSQDSDYASEINDLLTHVNNNQLLVEFSSSSFRKKPVHVEHFAMIADLEEINRTISSMDQIINDTTSVLAKLRRLNPPAEYASYHAFYLETMESYLTALVNKRNFYDQNKYTASNIKDLIEKGNVTAVFTMSKLTDENEIHKSNLLLSYNTLKSATEEFYNLIR